MKEIKIVMLLLATGFCSIGSATPKVPRTYFPDTFKGGLQTSQSNLATNVAAIGVEGKYEYHIQYIKFQLDYISKEKTKKKKAGIKKVVKKKNDQVQIHAMKSPGCDRADIL